jgi:hypothetical protein
MKIKKIIVWSMIGILFLSLSLFFILKDTYRFYRAEEVSLYEIRFTYEASSINELNRKYFSEGEWMPYEVPFKGYLFKVYCITYRYSSGGFCVLYIPDSFVRDNPELFTSTN